MSKTQKSNREQKKQPLLSAKEKRVAKQHKKELKASPVPFLPPKQA
ncbi:hypothetical protein GCM10025771_06520 [Niveibacterium umoris]|uniref:Uncharacterized protein n=1 Tax=Niveibacterium umoris TaxID=1193620 RepID=A0A840BJT4_9RHOO|nr:hypothetical protein [Niveibacterium umoris]MBB4013801.1 hypothetical protein [Niveibacterium umoris]